MSNSAFTPSTTTVTNNVPVNVPVVTDWVTYTPTISGTFLTSSTINWFKYRRVGSNLEINLSFSATYSNAGDSFSCRFSLPAGLTSASDTRPQANRDIGITVANVVAGIFVDANEIAITPSVGGGIFRNSSYIIIGKYTVPIAEWSGSGTTTLATRAVEEYAYNTNTGASNDTSSFGYGPDGVLFPNITTYGTIFAKRVRFQTSILSTDSIIVEYQQAGTGVWRSTAQRMPYVTMGNSAYGIQILNVSSTDVEIQFNSQGAVSNGLTYASNGEPWSAYHGAGWKWRVRKISSGAQVGYPVSARNIVGDTSGSVVPTGMLGETRVNSETGTTVPGSSGTWATIESITLGRGTWLVTGIGYYFTGSGTLPTGFSQFRAGLSTGATTSPDEGFYGFIQNPINIADGGGSVTVPPRVFTITSDSQQIFLVAYCLYSTVGTLVLNKNQSAIQAVRIA